MTSEMKRFYFTLTHTNQWYEIMRECRTWFGSNWRTQPKVRRKLAEPGSRRLTIPHQIWFDVPDERFATWISIKMAVEVIG